RACRSFGGQGGTVSRGRGRGNGWMGLILGMGGFWSPAVHRCNENTTECKVNLTTAAEAYFADLHRVRASGGPTWERSYYPALANLIGAVGRTLKPKVFCVLEGADQGAGHPDYAIYTAKQVQKGRPQEGQVPERGVVEVKGVGEDAWLTAESDQVSRYWGHYRLVLVTNLRDFVLVGADGSGSPARLDQERVSERR
ncbi:MAG: hypothetical protein OXF01_13030, partial [Gemmatimonadetes bacterium]|nr:hypothetical protein [Gemmatimonadota bacterium]